MGIDRHFLKLCESFLGNRYQRVVLNGQGSSWTNVKAVLPQGSILGPLFFLIYINDLSENIKSAVKFYAGDTLIFHLVKDPNTSAETRTLLEFQNGHTDGKYHSIWTLRRKPRKCCFLIKLRR